MKILILGGDGMLGHQLLRSFMTRHDVRVTLKQSPPLYEKYGIFNTRNTYYGVYANVFESLVEVAGDFKPEAIINCIGIVKQRSTAKESIPSLEINALLPHRLAVICKAIGSRLIHLSTDCVFSGKKGNYLESDLSDAEDLYGQTKYLGEVQEEHCLTLRTSIIGRELSRKKSLFEWFLAQQNSIKGFTKAQYNGFTTIEMARIIEKMLLEYPSASGVYQVSSEPISKYDLLRLIREKMNKNIEIESNDTFMCDRTLDSTRFRREFNYTPPSWSEMIEELIALDL
jgi:dTDP-4-dehydrorhamnose reductase